MLTPSPVPTAGSRIAHQPTCPQRSHHPPCCSRCSASSPTQRPYSASPKPTAPAPATSSIASQQLMPMTTTPGSRSAWRSTVPVMTPSFKIGSAGPPSQASLSPASAKPSGRPSTAQQVASALAPLRTSQAMKKAARSSPPSGLQKHPTHGSKSSLHHAPTSSSSSNQMNSYPSSANS